MCICQFRLQNMYPSIYFQYMLLKSSDYYFMKKHGESKYSLALNTSHAYFIRAHDWSKPDRIRLGPDPIILNSS